MRMVPLIFSEDRRMLVALFSAVSSYLVVNFASRFGKKSLFAKSLMVIVGFMMFSGMVYSSFSSASKFLASSKEMANSIPFSSLYSFLLVSS